MNQLKMQCLCCDKTLDPVTDDAPYQPNSGVICDTSGNYGSRAFDACFGERLVFWLCDDCLVAKKERVLYYGPTRDEVHQPMDHKPDPVPWNLVPDLARNREHAASQRDHDEFSRYPGGLLIGP